jgi:flagellum-specific ATP synthase
MMTSLADSLQADITAINEDRQLSMFGHVSRFDGQMIECGGFPANIGSLCSVETDDEQPAIAEVIGLTRATTCCRCISLVPAFVLVPG